MMKYKNYTFFRNNEWNFEVEESYSLSGYSSYCTAKGDSLINAVCTIVNNKVKVKFLTSVTNVKTGIYKYDVEIYNSGINKTIQRGQIAVI